MLNIAVCSGLRVRRVHIVGEIVDNVRVTFYDDTVGWMDYLFDNLILF